MKKQTLIEKVQIVNHNEFWKLILFTFVSGVISFLISLLALGLTKVTPTIERILLITLSLTFIYLLIYLYKNFKEEITEEIEKEVWIK